MKISILRSFFFGLLIAAPGFLRADEAPKPIHALLIAGGCCHDYVAQTNLLTKGISARANVTWDILFEGGSSRGGVIRDHQMSIYEKPNWAEGYDVVVHDECFGDQTNADFINHIAKAHFDGVPAVVIHCSIHSYRKSSTDEWRKLLGVSSFYHDAARKFQVENLQPDNPIMKGFPAIWQDPAPDELYRMKKVWPNCVPLARTIATNMTPNTTCVWINTYGKARVFGTTLGHGNTTVSNPTYLDLVTRGLLWACNKLDADGNPAPGYGPAPGDRKDIK
jgi:type 1 glutamine amidotransferase